uniref:Uncharacterized protein n=1 Tax=Oryza rufipogon TaxID=4529 RepID=A0A0E0R4K7_ORYRU
MGEEEVGRRELVGWRNSGESPGRGGPAARCSPSGGGAARAVGAEEPRHRRRGRGGRSHGTGGGVMGGERRGRSVAERRSRGIGGGVATRRSRGTVDRVAGGRGVEELRSGGDGQAALVLGAVGAAGRRRSEERPGGEEARSEEQRGNAVRGAAARGDTPVKFFYGRKRFSSGSGGQMGPKDNISLY